MGILRWVPQRLALLAVVLAGWGLSAGLGLGDVSSSPLYLYGTSLLLGIGLYGSTYGIDRQAAREHRTLIVAAVTVGVVLKAALIGGVLLLATQDPLYLILGVAMAQIDPLSVAAILGDRRMSPRAKTILASWASFDDPVTVILVVYVAAIAYTSFGVGAASGTRLDLLDSLLRYGADVAANLVLAGLAVLAWQVLRHRPRVLATTLCLLAVVAVWQFLMLGVAIAGLFIRPAAASRVIMRLTQLAWLVAAGLLGMLLIGGVSLVGGGLLGVMAFVAQMVVGAAFTRHLSTVDRVHLMLAQQNGITAIILGLRLEVDYPGSVAAVAPAIVVTNAVYFGSNWLADRVDERQSRSRPATDADPAGPAGPPTR